MSGRTLSFSALRVHAEFQEQEKIDRTSDLAALDEIAYKLRCIRLRDEVRPHVTADMRALGIDSPETRLKAALQYMRLQRSLAIGAVSRIGLLMVAASFASDNAAAAGHAGWTGILDVYEARARVQREYGEKAAVIVSQAFIPARLREIGSDGPR